MTKYAIEGKTSEPIVDEIRETAIEETHQFTPAQMPQQIEQAVNLNRESAYQMGASENYESAFANGQEQGKKDAYDAFWDIFQNNGKRTEYYAGFAGAGWTTENFKPKYDIKPSGNTYGMFQKSRIHVDLVEFAKEQGIEISFSNATDLQYGFANTYFKRIGLIDGSKIGNLIRCFEINPYLKIIDKIILKSDGGTNLSNAFNQCYELEEIRFEGVIGTNGVNFYPCKLPSYDSLRSIIDALKDRSGESSAYTCTLGEENLAKLTEEEIKTATDKGWTLV